MARNLTIFFGMGVVWLFVFSIPIGKGKSIYEVLHYYVVDTRPVQWVAQKVLGSYEATLDATETAQQNSDKAWRSSRDKVQESAEILKVIE